MSMRNLSRHAEDLGNGVVAEPGAEFEEKNADPAVIQRLQDAGKVAPLKSTPTKAEAK
jgi:hypothetical protein